MMMREVIIMMIIMIVIMIVIMIMIVMIVIPESMAKLLIWVSTSAHFKR